MSTSAPRLRLVCASATLALVTGLIAAWTLRAVTPSAPLPDAVDDRFYLPMPEGAEFTLGLAENGTETYLFTGTADCVGEDGTAATAVERSGALLCRAGRPGVRLRLRLDTLTNQHRLVLDGFTVDVPANAGDAELAVAGLARDADAVLPFPGIGARHAILYGPAACPPGEDPGEVLACVGNGGLRGSLVVDSSQRLAGEGRGPAGAAAPLVRRAPARDEVVPLRDGDLLWTGQVPMAVGRARVDRGGTTVVEFRVPQAGIDPEGWLEAGGDRRWMSLDLPGWSLARLSQTDLGWEVSGPRAFRFFAREALFSTPVRPWAWDMHLAASRIEWQQEEQVQELIDHELLCLASTFDPHAARSNHAPFPVELSWNLATGVGCDGTAVAPPPVALQRKAEEWAQDRVFNDGLRRAAQTLRDLPEKVPDPGDLGFVFDWARTIDKSAELSVVPVRLLGVRPFSTLNGPSAEGGAPAVDDEDDCDLAKSGWGRPPILLQPGSTSAYLRVSSVEGANARAKKLREGTLMLLVEDAASVCVGSKIPEDVKVKGTEGTLLLGHLAASVNDLQWSAKAPLADATSTCALLKRVDGSWQISRQGTGMVSIAATAETRVGPGAGPEQEQLALEMRRPLANGDTVAVLAGGVEVSFEVVLDAAPDRAAFSEPSDDRIVRRYPFGEALAGVLGVQNAVWSGLESWLEPEVWRSAGDQWEDSCDEPPAERAGVTLTLQGDLQRIVYGELEATRRAEQSGGAISTGAESGELEAHKILRLSAVLMDGATGDLLAVANAPSFDPNDAVGLRELQDALKRRDGRWRAPPELDNLAFRRNQNVGSVYKLATSYAMARGGLFEQGGTPLGTRCWRMGFRGSKVGADGTITTVPPLSKTDRRTAELVQCSEHAIGVRQYPIGDPALGFQEAFAESWNPYFSLASLALAPASGITFQLTPARSLSAPGILDYDQAAPRGEGTLPVQDLVFSTSFDVSEDLGRGNAFFSTLVELGHRYHYGTALNTQWADQVNETLFTAVDSRRWLPGVRVGGFYYPSVTGPELYGLDIGETRHLDLRTRRGTDERSWSLNVGVEHVAAYAKLAYGMGGVQSNALALAVLGTPMVAAGNVVAPDLVLGQGEAERRFVSEGFLVENERKRIEAAMRAVARTGTARSWYGTGALWQGVGAKTGTFDVAAPRAVELSAPASSARHQSVREVETWACGQVGARFDRADWQVVQAYADRQGRSDRTQRPYLRDLVRRVVDEGYTPPHGFAAGSRTCARWNPNRAGVSLDVGANVVVDGGVWLDELMRLYSPPAPEVLVPGSSLVTVVFDGLVPGLSGPDSGQGWVLAVVADGDRDAAKVASARILDRLRQLLVLHQSPEPGGN